MANTLNSINYTGTGFTINYTLESVSFQGVILVSAQDSSMHRIRDMGTPAGTYTDTFSSASDLVSGATYKVQAGESNLVDVGYYAGEAKTLAYNANGGSGAPSSQSSCWTSNSTLTAFKHTLSNTTPTWSGHTFQGWATSSTATTAKYQAGQRIAVSSSASSDTLYAVWSTDYSLAYNANSGSGAPSTQTATSNAKSYTFTIPTTMPTRSGYTFKGWATSSTATSAAYQPGGTYTVQASDYSKTLYAVWVKASPALRVKVNGAWKTATAVYVKVNGTWKAATAAYVKVSGAWKQST